MKKDQVKVDNKKTKGKLLKAVGILIGLILIFILLRGVNFQELFDQIRRIGINFGLVIAVTFAAQYLAVIAWLLSFLHPLPLKSLWMLFMIRVTGESLAQINPTSVIAGEILKSAMLKNLLNVQYREGGVSVILSRAMIVLSSAFFLVLGAVAVYNISDIPLLKNICIVISVVTVLFFVLIFYSLESGHGFLGFVNKLRKYKIGSVELVKKITNYLDEVNTDLLLYYKNKKYSFYASFLLCVLHRVVGSMEFYVIFHALGFNVDLSMCILFDISSMIFRAAGSFIPGQVGLEEISNKLMFSIMNISGSETWLTVSLVRRARQITWILIGFLFYLLLTGISGKKNFDGELDESSFRNS